MTKLHPDFAAFITNYAKKKEAERKAAELPPALFYDLRNGGNLPKRDWSLWIPLLATLFWLGFIMFVGVIKWLLS